MSSVDYEILYQKQERDTQSVLKWIKLLDLVTTPDGVGTVVELKLPRYNPLHYDPSYIKAVVWYGIDREDIRISWSEYNLYELTPGPINSSENS